MYVAAEYENETLDWLSKHLVELMLGLLVGFMMWEAKLLLDLKDQVTVNTVQIGHINKAVNDVGVNDKTLRELVVETRQDVEILKARTQYRYEK